MQPSQACPRCGYNQIPNVPKQPVWLLRGALSQYLSMRMVMLVMITILGSMFTFTFVVLILRDHTIKLLPDDMTPVGNYLFSIFYFFGYLSVILLVVGVFPYYRAPRVHGSMYTCGNCKFAWAEMDNYDLQTFEHIRYRRTQYNQAYIIEGVSCPKEECVSTAIVSAPFVQNFTSNILYRLTRGKYFVYLFSFLLTIVVAELFIDKLREALWLIPFGLLGLLVAFRYAQNSWLGYQKVQMSGRSYVCSNCRTFWYNYNYQPHTSELRRKWYEAQTRRARQLGNQREEANNMVALAAITGYEQGDWQQATTLLTQSAALYQRLGINIVPTGYYLWWAVSLLEAGKLQEAQEMISQGLSQGAKERNWPNYEQVAQATQGMIYLKAEQLEEARQAFHRNLSLFRKIEGYQPKSEPVALRGLAEIALKEGMAVQALQLCGAYQAMLDQAGIILLPKEQDRLQGLIEAARSRLDTPSYLAAWREGSQMSFDQAIEYAFRLTAAPLG